MVGKWISTRASDNTVIYCIVYFEIALYLPNLQLLILWLLVIALVDPLPHPQILVYFITGEKKACIKSGT